uniref:Uncharacterized protein n=1 Tax=Timema cristinae TaxID=61476 RepID=A0A7R9CIH8_TIMCR|nr:unnamed protein product [Timema cristinae]
MAEIIVKPLDNPDFITTLRTFCGILRSCLGPKSGVKMLVSGGDYLTITSASSRIIRNIPLSDPICVFIAQIMKAQLEKCNNFGLYTGILVSSIIEQVLSKKDKVAISLATVVLQEILPKLSSFLKSDCLKIPINFSSVKQLIHIVNSVLLSKPMCGLTVHEVEPLGVCLVKAFLGSIGEEMGEVIVISGDGTQCDSRLYPGVLYMFDVHDNLLDLLEKQFHGGTEDLLLALFNIMLTNDECGNKLSNDSNKIRITSESSFNTESEFLKQAMLVIEQAINSGVKIIACQKVVHPMLRMHLRRKGVLLLDRLGTAPAQAVQKLSGAVPISSLTRYVENLDMMLGRVTSVRRLICDGKEYLHLQRKGGNVTTLFVNAIGEEATIELKVCVEQSLSLLYQLVSQPVVTPGAGCFDMFLSASLQQESAMGYSRLGGLGSDEVEGSRSAWDYPRLEGPDYDEVGGSWRVQWVIQDEKSLVPMS